MVLNRVGICHNLCFWHHCLYTNPGIVGAGLCSRSGDISTSTMSAMTKNSENAVKRNAQTKDRRMWKFPARMGLLFFFLFAPLVSVQEHIIKLATLAPEGSSWFNAVKAIGLDVRQATDGAVRFKIYPGGVQ